MVQQIQTWTLENGFTIAVHALSFLLVLIAGWVLIRVLKRALGVVLRRSNRVSLMLEKFVVDVSVKALWVMAWLVALAQLGICIPYLINNYHGTR